MRYLFLCLLPTILHGQTIQLAAPQFTSGDVFFKGKTSVSMEFALENASIHYTINANPTANSPTYTLPLQIDKSLVVSAIACHPDFLPSAPTERIFVAANHTPDSMHLFSAAHEKYPGKGAASLFDLKKGSTNIQDGNWLGFSANTIIVEAFFLDEIICKQVVLSSLSDYKSWILPFKKVIIQGKNRVGNWIEIGQWQAKDPSKLIAEKAEYANFLTLKLKRLKTRTFRIEIEPFGNLPEGHPGAGTPAWLFLDEIIFQ